MSRERLMTYAKGRGVKFDEPAALPPGFVPVTDHSPMGYAIRDEEQVRVHLSGEIAELQRLVALLSADRGGEQAEQDLRRILASTAQALAHASRLRGIHETIATLKETP